jgi:hypothetical protein
MPARDGMGAAAQMGGAAAQMGATAVLGSRSVGTASRWERTQNGTGVGADVSTEERRPRRGQTQDRAEVPTRRWVSEESAGKRPVWNGRDMAT